MNRLLPEVQAFVETLEFPNIPNERKADLEQLSAYILEKLKKEEDVNLNFICTHNSRRSQLAQVWAYTAAYYHGVPHVQAFSGGTEATAFHPNAIKALEKAGFRITKKDEQANPVYFILCAHDAEPLPCFSKVYDDAINALMRFAAIMTCSDAEKNCPYIPGAEARFSVKYEDPKQADGTALEEEIYAARSQQIATEMFFVFTAVAEKWKADKQDQ